MSQRQEKKDVSAQEESESFPFLFFPFVLFEACSGLDDATHIGKNRIYSVY